MAIIEIRYSGSMQTIVTSSAQNDSGLFETNLRDERYLPFENSGVIREWSLELPANPSLGDPAQFDHDTISDVILHVRYTAREGGELLRKGANVQLSTCNRPRYWALKAQHELGAEPSWPISYGYAIKRRAK